MFYPTQPFKFSGKTFPTWNKCEINMSVDDIFKMFHIVQEKTLQRKRKKIERRGDRRERRKEKKMQRERGGGLHINSIFLASFNNNCNDIKNI